MELIEEKILKLPLYTEPLTLSDYENIFCAKKHKNEFIKLNGKIYHVKDTFLFLNELIGEEVSKYFNLQTVDSIFSIRTLSTSLPDCDEMLLLTELFTNKHQKYDDVYLFQKFKFYDDIGLDNIDCLYCYSPKNTTEVINISSKYYLKLQEDIKKLCIRDFITQQRDRHSDNFMFSYDNEKVELIPVFDYEHSFGDGRFLDKYFGYFDFDLELDKVIEYSKKDSFIQMLLKKAMNMDMNLIIDKLKNKGIVLNQNERVQYIDCVEEQKEAIIKAGLII